MRTYSQISDHRGFVASKISKEMEGRVTASIELFSNDLGAVVSEVVFLSESSFLKGCIVRKKLSAECVNRYESDLISLQLRLSNIYQLRVIDNDGQELIRLAQRDSAYPVLEQTQNKKGRYYIQALSSSKKPGVYVSPLDLNVENGEIESPLRPMIRVGAPIFDNDQNNVGSIIINYDAGKIIKALEGTTSLINNEGYWLKGCASGCDWGFMFGNPKKFSQSIEGNIFNINSLPIGLFESKGDLFYHQVLEISKVIDRGVHRNVRFHDSPFNNFYKLHFFERVSQSDVSKQVKWYSLEKIHVFALMVFIVMLLVFAIAQSTWKDIVFTQELSLERDKAVNLAKEKSDFVSTVSHEIRTPLNGIIGLSDLLSDEDVSPAIKSQIKSIKSSGEQLLSLINDVLDFSKIEADNLVLEMKDFNLHELIHKIVDPMKIVGHEKEVDINVRWDERLPKRVHSDQTRISQIVTNLVGNALKFTNHGQVEISLEMVLDRNFDNLIQIRVKDSGVGIAKEKLSKIFEPFTQAEDYTTRKYGGTGLGLTITKDLVDRLGGEISVDSVEGLGCEFVVKLPYKEAETIEFTPAKESQRDSVDLPSAHGFNILVAEDNFLNQKVLSRYLEKTGASFTIAENGEQALKQAKNKEYDLIFMDVQMPIMNGIEATKLIRAFGKDVGYQPLIIALTAQSESDGRDECIDAGTDGFISKPFSRKDISEAIEMMIKYKQENSFDLSA